MKKIVLCILSFFLMICSVFAEEYTLIPEKKEGKYQIKVEVNNGSISYNEAIEKYGLSSYIDLYVEEGQKYFYLGKEITYDEYYKGITSLKADERVKEYGQYGIRVHNEKELLEAINTIMKNYKSGEYHLVYSEYEKSKIDFTHFEEEYTKQYIMDGKKNIYTYKEYGRMQPIRFLPDYTNEEVIINANIFKTTMEEEHLVEEFWNSLLPYFENLSEYEKALGIYTYLNQTTEYITDSGYTIFQKGYLSPYDALLQKKIVCIGAATTFQFMAEKLGLTSYIVDHVAEINPEMKVYNTIHTYNIIRLDEKWYIIDINNKNDLSGFLIGKNTNYSEKDLEYLSVSIEEKSYFDTFPNVEKDFAFAYEDLNKVISQIMKKAPKEVETTKKREEEKVIVGKDETIYYIVLSLLLIIIFLVIFIFTRKNRK